jgi:hypothetical protein
MGSRSPDELLVLKSATDTPYGDQMQSVMTQAFYPTPNEELKQDFSKVDS